MKTQNGKRYRLILLSVLLVLALFLTGCPDSASEKDQVLPFPDFFRNLFNPGSSPSPSPGPSLAPSPNPTSSPEQNNPNLSATDSIEQSVFQQINSYRTSKGLTPLIRDDRMDVQARNHSGEMANGTVPFGHQGFDQRVAATQINYQAAAENVAWNQGYSDPATRAVQDWLGSSGHLANIQGNYNLTGVGVVQTSDGKCYFTQLFILSQ